MKFCSVVVGILVLAAISCKSVIPHFPPLTDTVVKVCVETEAFSSSGSAVLVDSKKVESGYQLSFLTAKHNIRDVKIENLTIQFFSFSDVPDFTLPVIRATSHPGLDLAVLVVLSDIYHTPAQRATGPIIPLSEVFSVGYPLGIGMMVTSGFICIDFKQGSNPSWICSAPLFLGNSGGGVFDRASNKLIGISIQMLTGDGTLSSAVPHLHVLVPATHFNGWLRELGI